MRNLTPQDTIRLLQLTNLTVTQIQLNTKVINHLILLLATPPRTLR